MTMSKTTRLEDKSAQREARYAPRRPKRDPATYCLPALLAAAITTNRSELCEVFAKQLEAVSDEAGDEIRIGHAMIAKKSIPDMARLIGDLLDDRASMTLRLHDLETGLKNVRNQITAFEAAMDDALGHASGEDLEEDDDERDAQEAAIQRLLDAGYTAKQIEDAADKLAADHAPIA
jgi:hypothetical protein